MLQVHSDTEDCLEPGTRRAVPAGRRVRCGHSWNSALVSVRALAEFPHLLGLREHGGLEGTCPDSLDPRSVPSAQDASSPVPAPAAGGGMGGGGLLTYEQKIGSFKINEDPGVHGLPFRVFENFIVIPVGSSGSRMPRPLFDQLTVSQGRKRAVCFLMFSRTTPAAALPFPMFNALCSQAKKISLS